MTGVILAADGKVETFAHTATRGAEIEDQVHVLSLDLQTKLSAIDPSPSVIVIRLADGRERHGFTAPKEKRAHCEGAVTAVARAVCTKVYLKAGPGILSACRPQLTTLDEVKSGAKQLVDDADYIDAAQGALAARALASSAP